MVAMTWKPEGATHRNERAEMLALWYRHDGTRWQYWSGWRRAWFASAITPDEAMRLKTI